MWPTGLKCLAVQPALPSSAHFAAGVPQEFAFFPQFGFYISFRKFLYYKVIFIHPSTHHLHNENYWLYGINKVLCLVSKHHIVCFTFMASHQFNYVRIQVHLPFGDHPRSNMCYSVHVELKFLYVHKVSFWQQVTISILVFPSTRISVHAHFERNGKI